MPPLTSLHFLDHASAAQRAAGVSGLEQTAQIATASFADVAEFATFVLATRATSPVASAGPTPGISSNRRLPSLDRCQALIRPPVGAAYLSSKAVLLERPPPRRVASELFCAEPHLWDRQEFGDNVCASG